MKNEYETKSLAIDVVAHWIKGEPGRDILAEPTPFFADGSDGSVLTADESGQ